MAPYTLQTLPDLEKEVFEWEQKYKAIDSLDNLRQKITHLKNEIAWALIHEKEKVEYSDHLSFRTYFQSPNEPAAYVRTLVLPRNQLNVTLLLHRLW